MGKHKRNKPSSRNFRWSEYGPDVYKEHITWFDIKPKNYT